MYTNDFLYFFNSVPGHHKPSIRCRLAECIPEAAEHVDPTRKYCFIFKIEKYTLFISCETRNEKQNWINAHQGLVTEFWDKGICTFKTIYNNKSAVLEISAHGLALKTNIPVWKYTVKQIKSFQVINDKIEFEFTEGKGSPVFTETLQFNAVNECTNAIRNAMRCQIPQTKIRFSAELA